MRNRTRNVAAKVATVDVAGNPGNSFIKPGMAAQAPAALGNFPAAAIAAQSEVINHAEIDNHPAVPSEASTITNEMLHGNPKSIKDWAKVTKTYALTELGLGERFINAEGADWLFVVSDGGKELVIYRHHWCRCGLTDCKHGYYRKSSMEELQIAMAKFGRKILELEANLVRQEVWDAGFHQKMKDDERAALAAEANEAAKPYRAFKNQLENGRKISTAANRILTAIEIQDAGHLVIEPGVLDSDPDILNTHAGIVDLATGERLPCTPSAYLSKITAGSGIDVPTIAALQKVLHTYGLTGDGIVDFLQIFYGTGCSGRSPEAFLHQYGVGGCGKSALSVAAYLALGDVGDNGYAMTQSVDVIAGVDGKDGEKPTPFLNELEGVRTLQIDEAAKVTLRANLLKQLTSGVVMNTRTLHKAGKRWKAQVTLISSGNGRVNLPASDTGIERRLLPVHFTQAPAKPDTSIKVALNETQAGKDAVLAWMIRGAVSWYQMGRPLFSEIAPDAVLAERATYLGGSELFDAWWDDCVEVVPDDVEDPLNWGDPAPTPADVLRSYRNYTKDKMGLDTLCGILEKRGTPATGLTEKKRSGTDKTPKRRVPKIRLKSSPLFDLVN